MRKSKIRRVTTAEVHLDYEGSITLDSILLEAADSSPFEQVNTLDITNGSAIADLSDSRASTAATPLALLKEGDQWRD
jgi:aspartate 1-decarboxylase